MWMVQRTEHPAPAAARHRQTHRLPAGQATRDFSQRRQADGLARHLRAVPREAFSAPADRSRRLMGKIEIIGAQPDPLPPPAVRCPHCKTERPPYGFILNGGDLGIVGQVQYFTIFCGATVSGAEEK